MKAIFLAITAAAAALLLSACQRDELQGGSISGEEVSVSISAVMPDGGSAVVKSDTEPGDGSLANRCIMQIYYLPDGESGSADPIPYGDRVTVAVSGMKALFPDQRLVSGHDYRFVFWADHVTDNSSAETLAQDLHYDTEEFPIVSFKEKEDGTLSYSSNDDKRDAFFTAEVRNISGPSSLSFDLKRPFGQLNIITTDWGAIPDDVVEHLRPSYVKLEFSSLPNSIDLVSGEVTGSVNISSEVAPVSWVPENGDSKQLSFDYILVKDGGEQTFLADFTMNFLLDDGTDVTDPYTFTNIPVQRNYKTNVSGNLLTDRTGIEVEVVPNFNDPALVYDTEEFYNVMEKGGYVALAEDITITDDAPVVIDGGVDVIINLAGHTITRSGEDNGQNGVWAFRVDNGTLTLEDSEGTGEIDGGSGLEHVTLWANGSNSKIVIKGGNYTVGGNSTGNNYNTCVYASNGGQVEIYGGTFGNEAPQTGSQDLYPALNLQNGSPGTIKVYGGTFINYDPATGDDNLGGTFVADGHSSIQVSYDPAPNGTFEVVENGRQVSVPVEINSVESFKSALSNDAVAEISVDADIDLSTATAAELTFTRHKTIEIASGTTVKLGDQNYFEAKAGLTLTGEGTIDNTPETGTQSAVTLAETEEPVHAQKVLVKVTGGDLLLDGVSLVNDLSYHWHGKGGDEFLSAAVLYMNDVDVEIRNVNIKSGMYAVRGVEHSSGTVTLQDSYFESTSTNKDNGKNWAYAVVLCGSRIVVENCEVKGTQGALSVEESKDVTVNGGKYYTVNTDGNIDAFYPLYVTNGAVVTINSGEFYSPNDRSGGLEIGGTSTVVSGDNDAGLPLGSVILKGGKFSGKPYNFGTNTIYEPAEGYVYKEITGYETFKYEVVPK